MQNIILLTSIKWIRDNSWNPWEVSFLDWIHRCSGKADSKKCCTFSTWWDFTWLIYRNRATPRTYGDDPHKHGKTNRLIVRNRHKFLNQFFQHFHRYFMGFKIGSAIGKVSRYKRAPLGGVYSVKQLLKHWIARDLNQRNNNFIWRIIPGADAWDNPL